MSTVSHEPRRPSLILSIGVFLAIAALIAAAVLVWETDIHIVLIMGALLAGIIGVAATFVVMTGLLYGLRRVRASSSPPTTPPAPGHPARA